MSKRIIFVDLDETLWHSTTPVFIERNFLLPANLVGNRPAENAIRKEIEDGAKRLLNDKGLMDGSFEFQSKRFDAEKEMVSAIAVRNGWKEFWFESGEHYLSVLRPKAVEFLTAISKIGELHVCTSSVREYANLLTEAFGIKKFFKTISSREQLKSADVFPMKDGTQWILIDDLPPFSDSIMRKMRFLAGVNGTPWDEGKKRVFQVEEFMGNPLDDSLMPYVEGIKEKFERIS